MSDAGLAEASLEGHVASGWDLLGRLVAVPSVTGDTEACVRVLLEWAREQDLSHGVLETGAPWISTVDAPFVLEEAQAQTLLFGHLDTVPGHIEVRLEQDRGDAVLHGRGTVDAKGCIAAFAALVSSRPSQPVTLIAAVDEEGDSETAHAVAELLASRPPARLVIGEPSGSDGVCLGYKGRVLVTVSVETPTAHGGAPVVTATDRLLEAMSLVRRRWGIDAAAEDGTFFDRDTAKTLRVMTENDGLRERAIALVDFRLSPATEPRELVAELNGVVGDDDVRVTLHESLPAVTIDRKGPLVRVVRAAVRRVTGGAARLVRKTGTADLNILLPAWPATDAVVYGPGDSSLDHTPEEQIRRSEFAVAVAVLFDVLDAPGGRQR